MGIDLVWLSETYSISVSVGKKSWMISWIFFLLLLCSV